MKSLLLLLVAIALVILGARGTYKAVWNQYFPNEPIVTTPTTTGANATTPNSSGAYVVPAQPNSTANSSGQAPKVTPNQTVTGSGNAATNTTGQTQPGQHVTVITGGASYPVQSVPISPTYQQYVSNAPSWWPSWLPWAFGG